MTLSYMSTVYLMILELCFGCNMNCMVFTAAQHHDQFPKTYFKPCWLQTHTGHWCWKMPLAAQQIWVTERAQKKSNHSFFQYLEEICSENPNHYYYLLNLKYTLQDKPLVWNALKQHVFKLVWIQFSFVNNVLHR